MKLYVGMGLTQAPKEFSKDFQNELKDDLRAIAGVEILNFIGLEEGTDKEVYQYDRDCTESADLCIFIVDYPSIGVGIEIALRLATGKPMIIFAEGDAKITRMLTGLSVSEGVLFKRYQVTSEIGIHVNKWVTANIK